MTYEGLNPQHILFEWTVLILMGNNMQKRLISNIREKNGNYAGNDEWTHDAEDDDEKY